MINIATLLLTRKCNLSCNYCRISGDIDYMLKPEEYPNSKHYNTNERTTEFWISLITEMYNHNKNMFFLIMGGEPFLYPGLVEIVMFLNDIGANYSILSNCTENLRGLRETFFSRVGKVSGFTASIDPGTVALLERETPKDHELQKSIEGFLTLQELMVGGYISDPVGEIVVDYRTIYQLEETIDLLSKNGIYSDISPLDLAKTNFYDFSTVTSEDALISKSDEVRAIFDRLINSDYKIHMKKSLLPAIYDALPSNLDCGLKVGNIHNITIDADGAIRTCLRIRGHYTPKYFANNLFNHDFSLNNEVEKAIEADKKSICKKCIHTCQIMSQLDYEDVNNH